jgi:hypothetical protein
MSHPSTALPGLGGSVVVLGRIDGTAVAAGACLATGVSG